MNENGVVLGETETDVFRGEHVLFGWICRWTGVPLWCLCQASDKGKIGQLSSLKIYTVEAFPQGGIS